MSCAAGSTNIEVLRAGAESASLIIAFERSYPSEGRIRLCLDRRASFFESFPISDQSIEVVLTKANEQITGLAVLNRIPVVGRVGAPIERMAYVSSLRILPQFRRGAAFRRGLLALSRLLASDPVDYLLGFVMEDNAEAKSMLLSGSHKYFQAKDLGSYCTYLIRRSRRSMGGDGASGVPSIQRATPKDAPELLQFLRTAGAGKSFFPHITEADLLGSGMFRGLRIEDFLLASSNGRVLGSLALWSQQSYRRWLVQGYRGLSEPIRHIYNVWAKAVGRFPLPPPGAGLRHCFASLCCVAPGNEWVIEELIAEAMVELRNSGQADVLVLGLHEDDPLSSFVSRLSGKTLRSRMLLMSLDGKSAADRIPVGVPHFEAGLL